MDNQDPKNSIDSELEQQSPDILPQQKEADSYLFFNVMPKSSGSDQVVPPVITSQPTKPSSPQLSPTVKSEPSFFGRNKVYIIIGVLVLILVPVLYYLFTKIGANSVSNDNFIVNNPHATTTLGSTATSSPDKLQGSNFTTPAEWRTQYFASCTKAEVCGDQADPDGDGLTNIQEFKAKTDPNNNDSDQDGLSDGDEVNVFNSDPLKSHTAGDPKYSDLDNAKGGYDITHKGVKLTSQQIAAIRANMAQFGLHLPTLTTLGSYILSVYNYAAPNLPVNNTNTPAATSTASSTNQSGLDMSISAKQDRDAQRSNTIRNIEAALLSYKTDQKVFPLASNFSDMYSIIKPYVKIATNPIDPINHDPYVYGYTVNGDQTDFTLSFYSEVAVQLIKKHASDALKDQQLDQANLYDNQRQSDLDTLRTALLLYSQNNTAGNQVYVFPTVDKYKTALVPIYIGQIPKDPKTGADYEYQVSKTFDSFTLKVTLDNPATGTTGYTCNQDECRAY